MKPIALFLTACAACGGTGAEPLSITGQVALTQDDVGGPLVLITATVGRPLEDGGIEPVTGAGVTLNGVPLGEPDPLRADATVPGQRVWAFASFPGAVPLGHETLAVTGSGESVSFDCPVAVSFLSPAEGATLDRNVPTDLVWTPGGAVGVAPSLTFGADPVTLDGGQEELFEGFDFLDPGSTTAQFGLGQSLPPGARLHFQLAVSGESASAVSVCNSVPILDVFYP
jgi:hypothetical protein